MGYNSWLVKLPTSMELVEILYTYSTYYDLLDPTWAWGHYKPQIPQAHDLTIT